MSYLSPERQFREIIDYFNANLRGATKRLGIKRRKLIHHEESPNREVIYSFGGQNVSPNMIRVDLKFSYPRQNDHQCEIGEVSEVSLRDSRERISRLRRIVSPDSGSLIVTQDHRNYGKILEVTFRGYELTSSIKIDGRNPIAQVYRPTFETLLFTNAHERNEKDDRARIRKAIELAFKMCTASLIRS